VLSHTNQMSSERLSVILLNVLENPSPVSFRLYLISMRNLRHELVPRPLTGDSNSPRYLASRKRLGIF